MKESANAAANGSCNGMPPENSAGSASKFALMESPRDQPRTARAWSPSHATGRPPIAVATLVSHIKSHHCDVCAGMKYTIRGLRVLDDIHLSYRIPTITGLGKRTAHHHQPEFRCNIRCSVIAASTSVNGPVASTVTSRPNSRTCSIRYSIPSAASTEHRLCPAGELSA